MIGFKGMEDLGGGINVFFLLEFGFNLIKGSFNGFDISNGIVLFNCCFYVGLFLVFVGFIKVGKNLFINNDIWYLDLIG